MRLLRPGTTPSDRRHVMLVFSILAASAAALALSAFVFGGPWVAFAGLGAVVIYGGFREGLRILVSRRFPKLRD